MASLGLKTFQPYLNCANSGSWSQDDEFDDPVLVIETSLSYNKEGFVSE
jgi:hypothetical protein